MQTKTARVLIKEGSDVNKADNAGRTPLHLAAYAGSEQVAAMLLAEGADIAAKDKMGNTPLHDVAGDLEYLKKRFVGGQEHGNIGSGKYFLSWSPPKTKLTAGHISTAKLLISKGLDSTTKNTAGVSAADVAGNLARDGLLRVFKEVCVSPLRCRCFRF